MGRQGDFVVKYDVKVQELQSQLAKVTKLFREHRNELAKAQGSQVIAADQKAMQTQTASINANTRAGNLLIRQQQRQERQQSRLLGQNKSLTKGFQTIGTSLRRLVVFWSSTALIFGAQRLAKSVAELAGQYQFVIRELVVLGEEGESVYRRLASAGFDAAAATGRSFNEAAEAMKAWVRQGFSAVEVADLTRTTLIGLNLTELTSIQLVRSLTAQMKAFNIPANQSITIIDKLLGVSRKYAIETTQLATGMRRFAAVSTEAGVSLDQQAGLMTAMMVRTQQAAQMVGRAGRTILVRIRRNAADVLKEIANVNVFTDETQQTYRNLFDVLSDTADAWDGLTDAGRANIAFAAAGLRQQEFFIALMKDFNIAQEAVIVSLESAGLAYKSNRLLVDTFQKSVAALRTEWNKLLAQQSPLLDFFQSLVNGFRSLISVASILPGWLIKIGITLTGLGGVALAVTVSPLVGGFLALASAATLLVSALGGLRDSGLSDILEHSKELTKARLAEANSTEKLTRLYIKYKKEIDEGKDREDLLLRTRKALVSINPQLITGTETLAETYSILTNALDDVSAAADKAERELRSLDKAQAAIALTQAEKAVREIRPGVQKALPEVDAFDSEKVIALARAWRDKLTPAIIDHANLTAAYSMVESKRTDVMKETAARYNDELMRRAEIYARLAQVTFFGPVELSDADIRSAQEDQLRDMQKSIDFDLQKTVTLERLANAFIAYNAAVEATIDRRFVGPPEKPGKVEETADADAIKKASRALEKKLELLELEIQIGVYKDARVAHHIIQAIELANLDQDILEMKRAELRVVEKTGKTLAERKAATELLAKLAEGGLEATKAELAFTKALHAETLKQDRITQKNQDDKLKAFEAERDALLKINAINVHSLESAIAMELSLQSAVLRRTKSELFVAEEVRAVWESYYLFRLDQENKLRESGVDPSSPEFKQVQDNTQRAQDKLDEATLNKKLAANQQLADSGEQIKRIQQTLSDISVADVERDKGKIAGLEEQLSILYQQRDAEKALVNTGKDAKDLGDIRIDIIKTENELLNAKKDLQDDINDAVKSGKDAEINAVARKIGLLQGEEAETEFLLAQDRKRRDNIKAGIGEKFTELDLIEQEAIVANRVAALEELRLKKKIDLAKESASLDAQREANTLQHEITMAELEGGRQAGLAVELKFWQEKLELAKQETELAKQKILIKQAENNIEDINNAKRAEDRSREISFQEELIRFAGRQVTAALAGDFGASELISNVSGLVGSALGGPLGVALATGGAILGSLFEGPADDLSDSLELNTNAIDRNTQTLQDVFAQAIGVPTGFTLPASIAMQGALPGGGATVINQNSIIIPIDGRGQDADQIANKVGTILTRQLNIDSRRGFNTNIFTLG